MDIENVLAGNSTLEAYYHGSDGSGRARGKIRSDHPSLLKVLEKANVDDLQWSSSWISYVPHLTLTSGDFSLDIHPNFMVVVDRLGKERWGQWDIPLENEIDTEALVKELGLESLPQIRREQPNRRGSP